MTVTPARILGATGHGGPIEAGRPANLVVFDPEERLDRRGAVRLEGAELGVPGPRARRRGVRHTMLRGPFTVADGKATR